MRAQRGRETVVGIEMREGATAAVDQALAQIEQRNREFSTLTHAFYHDQQVARQVSDILTLLLRTVVIIVALVGLFGIANTLLLNLAERRREFGILRALGAAAGQVFTVVVNEGLGLAAIGYAAGLAVGYPLARYLVDLTGHQLFRLSFTLSPAPYILALMLALLATAIGSSAPGLLAARLRPVEVLRYE